MSSPPVSLLLTASISPSEDSSKVLRSVRRILGRGVYDIDTRSDSIRATSSDIASLRLIRDQFRDRRIRSAARRLLTLSREGNKLLLLLNRQAAYQGIVALCSSEEESPLGPLFLTIKSSDPDSLIDWLTSLHELG